MQTFVWTGSLMGVLECRCFNVYSNIYSGDVLWALLLSDKYFWMLFDKKVLFFILFYNETEQIETFCSK